MRFEITPVLLSSHLNLLSAAPASKDQKKQKSQLRIFIMAEDKAANSSKPKVSARL